MRIAIIGYSGSGKSTLARELAETHRLPVLHFDAVQFLPGWEIRSSSEKERLTREFLDAHDEWVIDGTYSKLFYERRMAEADVIFFLCFNRFACLHRAYRRYKTFRNTTRPDMAEGCNEKFDFEFLKWILWKGRTRAVKRRYKELIRTYGDKVVVVRNQRQLDRCKERVANGNKNF